MAISLSNDLDIYNILDDEWNLIVSSGGTARRNYAIAESEGNIYTWGGLDLFTSLLDTMDIYNIAGNSWSTGLAGGIARSNHTGISYNGNIYYWGGTAGSGTLDTIDIYNITGNSWTTGLAGGTSRQDHSAVYYDGKIIFWGGKNITSSGETVWNGTALYNSGANTWSAATTGGDERRGHGAYLYNGNCYYVTGQGRNIDEGENYYALNTVDIYNIAGNSWSIGLSGGQTRCYAQVIGYNGKIYCWGGYRGYEAAYANATGLDIYDISSNTWSTGTDNGILRSSGPSIAYNGKLYFWGGGEIGPVNTMLIYDIALDSWSTGTPGGTAREYHGAALYGDKIYFYGGVTSGPSGQEIIDIYDIGDDSWTTGTNGNYPGNFVNMTAVKDDKIYFYGYSSIFGDFLFNIYDITNDSWSTKTAYTSASWWSTLVSDGSTFYLHGMNTTGGGVTTYLNTIDIYNIAGNSWTTGLAGGTKRSSHTAVVINGKMYCWGGRSEGGTVLNTLDIYDITGNSWSTGNSGGTARLYHSAAVYGGKMYIVGGTSDIAHVNYVTEVDIMTP